MSLTIPLAVRLKTSRADQHITADLRDLSFRETAPGGYASARLSLNRPLNFQPDDVDYYAHVYVYDGRCGRTVWEGNIEDPHRTAGSSGQVWELMAVGPAGRVNDRTTPYIMVDRDLAAMKRYNVNLVAATDSVREDPSGGNPGKQALVLQYPQGCTSFVGAEIRMRYNRIWDAGQKLARVDYQWTAGGTDANFTTHFMTGSNGALTTQLRTATLVPSTGFSPKVVVTDWSNGHNTFDLHHENAGPGSGLVPNDGFWAAFMDIVILAMRYNADGSEKTSGYSTNTVLASDVVADLVGRGYLPLFDGTNASIATTSFAIEQLAYPDGVTPGRVLDDLMKLETGYFWEARASNLTTGKYQFNWRAWPTTVRYEADVADGFDSPGRAADLFDKVRVRYTDLNGEIKNVQRSQSVPALTAAGLSREAFIDLGTDTGTQANAVQAGDQFLAQHASPPNSGTLTVARRILDVQRGCMVQPWEVEAGNLIRVRGVRPTVDALNATARDGVTVFRIVAREYSAADATAHLELDSYAPSIERQLAEVAKQQTQRTRR